MDIPSHAAPPVLDRQLRSSLFFSNVKSLRSQVLFSPQRFSHFVPLSNLAVSFPLSTYLLGEERSNKQNGCDISPLSIFFIVPLSPLCDLWSFVFFVFFFKAYFIYLKDEPLLACTCDVFIFEAAIDVHTAEQERNCKNCIHATSCLLKSSW